jgi:DNA-directed RNA polymerase subunit RPC12/RpoP
MNDAVYCSHCGQKLYLKIRNDMVVNVSKERPVERAKEKEEKEAK